MQGIHRLGAGLIWVSSLLYTEWTCVKNGIFQICQVVGLVFPTMHRGAPLSLESVADLWLSAGRSEQHPVSSEAHSSSLTSSQRGTDEL